MGKVTNEMLCSALLNHGSVKEAAVCLGISERTVYARMGDSDFVSMYASTQRKILNAAILACQCKVTEAVTVLGDIMQDTTINPQTRLLAAQTVIKNALAMMELSDTLKKREKESNRWGNSLLTDFDYED